MGGEYDVCWKASVVFCYQKSCRKWRGSISARTALGSASTNVDDKQDQLPIPSVDMNYFSDYEEKSVIENASPKTMWSPQEDQANWSKEVLTSPAIQKLNKENNIVPYF